MRSWVLGFALFAAGCAPEIVDGPSSPPRYPPTFAPAAPQPAVAASWGDVAGWRAAEPPPARSPRRRSTTQIEPPPPSALIPDGPQCLATLTSLGVAFDALETVKGVTTPVRVKGPIGGLRFRAVAGMPLVCDCRLAVALAWSAPHLRGLGIEELRFSGAYVDRRQRTGRPSLHARGLAIDVHAMATHADVFSVERDFERGVADGCRADAPLLNQAACRLKGLALYKELLTPDYNYDHHDHFHLGIAPLD